MNYLCGVMKILAILLSVFMLFLAVEPCGDAVNQESHLETTAQAPDHSQDQTDNCTASCYCSCCGTVIYIDQIATFGIFSKNLISTQLSSAYLVSYQFDFHTGIWQPPQDIS